MNGAEVMMRLAANLGSDVCFANLGTTELPFVAALDSVEGVRPVLGLHESVCTGAADGWARLTGKVGLNLLHLGVGLSNGLANLHNARCASTPIVTIVGDHPSWHLRNDPPLASDLFGIASSGTSRAIVSSDFDTARDAFNTAWGSARRDNTPVSLIVRADDAERAQPSWATTIDPLIVRSWRSRSDRYPTPMEVLDKLIRARNPAVLMGGSALSVTGKQAAHALRQALNTAVYTEPFPAIDHTGEGLPHFDTVAGKTAQETQNLLRAHDLLVLIGASDPVAFFADDPRLGRLRPDSAELLIASNRDGAEDLLREMGARLPRPSLRGRQSETQVLEYSDCELGTFTVASILIEQQPEGAIVVDEGNTAGGPYRMLAHKAAPHIRLNSSAGSLGFGMTAVIGAAIAEPHRRVIGIQSDGAAAYAPQALWTQAREQLNITTVLLNNGGYATVRSGWRSSGGSPTSTAAKMLSELAEPSLDWVSISEGFGVSALRVSDAKAFRGSLKESFNAAGPRLIVVDLDPS